MTREALLVGEKRNQARRFLDRLVYLPREHPTYWSLMGKQEIETALDKFEALVVESIEERNAERYGGKEEGV